MIVRRSSPPIARRAPRAALLGVLLLLGGLTACDPALRGDAGGPVEVGRPAPSYAATSLAGDSVSLAGLRGDVVLLNIWATWCHPCRTEIPELERLHQRFQSRGLQVVGVSVDVGGEDAAVAEFGKEYGLTYPVWRDPDGRVSTLFAALGVPATYLIGRDGTLLWRKVGPVTEAELGPKIEDALGEG